MERDSRAFLWDVRRAADLVAEFTAGLDAEGYVANRLVNAAVERQFEIIGEALNQLTKAAPGIAHRIPHLPEIVSFRNVLIHGYSKVDHQIVWSIIKTRLPVLRDIADALLAELGPPDA
ncbi:DUF86 domain-containing protein [Xanthobacteraceae bacterium Astr-EGSB]|uniref:HepT-like ribonuclease domain-containing protein n=1 Tax=Astrobacterium formosum TaxID=3069710 RepID=UPI0027B3A3EF|nr:DUF86 domain-containing protein [Xanthobacteraceae bacterium Astr-EGSB]